MTEYTIEEVCEAAARLVEARIFDLSNCSQSMSYGAAHVEENKNAERRIIAIQLREFLPAHPALFEAARAANVKEI